MRARSLLFASQRYQLVELFKESIVGCCSVLTLPHENLPVSQPSVVIDGVRQVGITAAFISVAVLSAPCGTDLAVLTTVGEAPDFFDIETRQLT